ncbi:hypothetical protein ACNR9V_06265 [Parageobacillus thermoglucosidasius]
MAGSQQSGCNGGNGERWKGCSEKRLPSYDREAETISNPSGGENS